MSAPSRSPPNRVKFPLFARNHPAGQALVASINPLENQHGPANETRDQGTGAEHARRHPGCRQYRVCGGQRACGLVRKADLKNPQTGTTIKTSRQHPLFDELHTRIGCQPVLDARFPRRAGRRHAANLPARALSSHNLRNPGTIISHWAFDCKGASVVVHQDQKEWFLSHRCRSLRDSPPRH